MNSATHKTGLYIILLCTFISAALRLQGQDVKPLPNAHAHNDYAQDRPLYDALENGFTSIEIDVHAFRNTIRVSHRGCRLRKKPTIGTLYLEPVSRLIEARGGWIYGKGVPVMFMIDLKTSSRRTLPLLAETLYPYRDLIDRDGNEDSVSAPLRIVLSGSVDIGDVMADTTGIFSADGSLSSISADYPVHIMPRVSGNYAGSFSWKGRGEIPADELARLRDLVTRAHAGGRKLRFWNHPHDEDVWRTLLENGVDWINVDRLEDFRKFMVERQTTGRP